MKGISLFLFAAAILVGQTGQIVNGRTSGGAKIMSGSVPLAASGLVFSFETRLDPSSPPIEGLGEGGAVNVGNVIRRDMVDRGRKVYFGYDVQLERLPQPHTYRIGFKKLGALPSGRGITPEWTNLEPPWYPEPQVVHFGDVIQMTVLVNKTSGQKIIDYISITEVPDGAQPIRVESQNGLAGLWQEWTGVARKSPVGEKELRLKAPRLTINGKEDATSVTHPQDASGATVWFYAANRGRFLLSLTPQTGFQQAGSIQGNHLAFGLGGSLYALDCADRIAAAPGLIMLYVLQEPNWKPAGNASDFMIGTDK